MSKNNVQVAAYYFPNWHVEDKPEEDRIITINAWNEWTEGAYIEPDTVNGYAYLEAIKNAVM